MSKLEKSNSEFLIMNNSYLDNSPRLRSAAAMAIFAILAACQDPTQKTPDTVQELEPSAPAEKTVDETRPEGANPYLWTEFQKLSDEVRGQVEPYVVWDKEGGEFMMKTCRKQIDALDGIIGNLEVSPIKACVDLRRPWTKAGIAAAKAENAANIKAGDAALEEAAEMLRKARTGEPIYLDCDDQGLYTTPEAIANCQDKNQARKQKWLQEKAAATGEFDLDEFLAEDLANSKAETEREKRETEAARKIREAAEKTEEPVKKEKESEEPKKEE